MRFDSFDLTLYHGSYCRVDAPDLSKCAKNKDFGRGFYFTTSIEQARSFAKTSLRKAVFSGIVPGIRHSGGVSAFKVSRERLSELKLLEFETTNFEWLHCIVAHRKQRGFEALILKYKDYDVIAGKVANDATNATITAYMSGLYGEIGSERAANFCIGMLLPERLVDQFCFRSEKAVLCLDFVSSEVVWA